MPAVTGPDYVSLSPVCFQLVLPGHCGPWPFSGVLADFTRYLLLLQVSAPQCAVTVVQGLLFGSP